jgi:hypothetical protein
MNSRQAPVLMPAARQHQARSEADASIAITQLEADRRDAAAAARKVGLAVPDICMLTCMRFTLLVIDETACVSAKLEHLSDMRAQ